MTFWNIVQQVQIENLRGSHMMAATNADVARQMGRNRDEQLRDDVERLSLVVEAMWSLLAERGGVTMQDLVDRMTAIDQADGVVDGRNTPTPQRCPSCAAAVPTDRETCQFCGAAVRSSSVF